MYINKSMLGAVTQVNPQAYDEYGDYVPNPVTVPVQRVPGLAFKLDAKTLTIGAVLLVALYLLLKKKG